jgi:N-formylglutamate amidohydrolase
MVDPLPYRWLRFGVVTAALAAVVPLAPAEPAAVPTDLITSQEGQLPIILSAPHGGVLPVPGVPERKGECLPKGAGGFVTVRDVNTDRLALALAEAIETKMGKKPYLVMAKLSRKHIDVNRPATMAYESPGARPVYESYHETLARFCKAVQRTYGRGLLLDLHGQAAARDTIFRGTKNGMTVKLLVERFGEKAHNGPESLFGLVAAQGCKVFPDPREGGKERQGFTGGHIVQTYGSHQGYGIDAMQFEFGGDYTDRVKIKSTAAKLADAIDAYAKRYLVDPPAKADRPHPGFVFRDIGDEAGVFPHLAGIRGHGAAWGDVTGDGWPDLFVATFHNAGSKPSLFLRNERGKFRLDAQAHLRTSGIGSGALFVDLTNNGRLDLYVSNCAHGADGVLAAPSVLVRNDGGGKFTDISKESGACPPAYAGRGLAATDVDGDGLLDLVTCERYYGAVKTGPVLYRNRGNYRFENASAAVGLPAGLSGLGIAVADVNNDGWPDIFLTSGDGNHRLLLNDGTGKFREAPGSREVFRWKDLGPEDTPAGVCIADVNRDGLPDIVIGHHTKAPWRSPLPVRLYLNRGIKDGVPTFEDVTEKAGLAPLAMKGPHVEIQDFDNDGWPDIYVSIVKFKDGRPHPIIYKNLGVKDGIPRFRADAWAVNDFPTDEDRNLRGSSSRFTSKMLKEKKIMYMAAGPSADFDRDGRLDLLLVNWWIEDRSLLLRNETPGGNWLDVRVEGSKGVNRMGIGSKVKVYPAGKLGEPAALLGAREISVGYGYCSGQEAVAHFGLGKESVVDLEVILPHNKGTVTQKGIKANQRITIKQ